MVAIVRAFFQIAVDVMSTKIELGTSTVALALWDTAGQERFAPLSAPYYRQADGVVVVFDVGSRRSFERVGSRGSHDACTILYACIQYTHESAHSMWYR